MERHEIGELLRLLSNAISRFSSSERISELERVQPWARSVIKACADVEALLRPPRRLHYKTAQKIFLLIEEVDGFRLLCQMLIAKPIPDEFDVERLSIEMARMSEPLSQHMQETSAYYLRRPTRSGQGSAPPRRAGAKVDDDDWLSPSLVPLDDGPADAHRQEYRLDVSDGSDAQKRALRMERQRIGATLVPLYFGTTRDRGPIDKTGDAADVFGNGGGSMNLKLGTAVVSIPPGHRIGELEQPLGVWKFRLKPSVHKHVVLTAADQLTESAWVIAARSELERSERKSAFVFIHGFNVTYEQAMLRGAQIARDVGYEGLVTAFSWGSAGSIDGYMADEIAVRLSVPALTEFLTLLHQDVGVAEFHVVAHSMGCRALLAALGKPFWTGQGTPISEAVFAAPDVDAQEYKTSMTNMLNCARRFTLYGSERDWALAVSRTIRKNFRRAGEGGDNVLVIQGVETIDATNIGEQLFGLGHSYIADKRTILGDLWAVCRGYLMPRFGLIERTHVEGRYWEFRP